LDSAFGVILSVSVWFFICVLSSAISLFFVTTHPKKNDCTNFQSMLRYKNEFS